MDDKRSAFSSSKQASTEDAAATTQVDLEQQVATVAGGQVAGVKVDTISGPVTINITGSTPPPSAAPAPVSESNTAMIARKPIQWPQLWPDVKQGNEIPVVAAWLRDSGTELQINPFAREHERAETDSLLPAVWVPPPRWEEIAAPGAAVVFGAPGCGKTATLMLLADSCQTTVSGAAELSPVFPIRLDLLPEGSSAEASAINWRRLLTRTVAEATLDFLARNPRLFSETPSAQQRALGRLFSMHRAALGDLARYLMGQGLERPIATYLAENIHEAARGTRPPALADGDAADLWPVLARSRLFPFEQIYLLAEIPDDSLALFVPEEIASYLRPVVPMMRSLAASRVYLKLSLPITQKSLLGPLPPGIAQVDLFWQAPALSQMLHQRLCQAAPSLENPRALFQRLPPGADPFSMLAEEALKWEGPPRRLIQLGRDLLIQHATRAPSEPKVQWQDLDAVLQKWKQGEKYHLDPFDESAL